MKREVEVEFMVKEVLIKRQRQEKTPSKRRGEKHEDMKRDLCEYTILDKNK